MIKEQAKDPEFIFHVENMERKFDRQILRGKTIVNQTLRMTISNF
jgi:hypothetical protein